MDVIELISLDSVDVGDPSKEINIVVEIPKGSSIKYEFDTATGLLFVDRKLYTAMNYPFNYGFIPKTLEMDGDPVDALILGDDPVVPLSIVKSRPIGVLLTEDEEGQEGRAGHAAADSVRLPRPGIADAAGRARSQVQQDW